MPGHFERPAKLFELYDRDSQYDAPAIGHASRSTIWIRYLDGTLLNLQANELVNEDVVQDRSRINTVGTTSIVPLTCSLD